MRRVAAAVAAFFIGCFLLPGLAEAGWEIHSRSTFSGGKAHQEVSFFQRDRFRMDSEENSTVMNFSTRKIIMIDSGDKKYSVMTFEEFKKLVRESMAAAKQAIDEMKRQGIPFPGGGAASRPKGEITVSRIAGATIAGFPCDGYRVSVAGEPREDIWVTKKIDLSGEIGPATWKEFEELALEMKKMGLDYDDLEEAAEYRKIMESGYPMKTEAQGSQFVQEVTRVKKKELPATMFQEPKGYEKVAFDKMTFGSSEGMPSGGEMPPWQGETMPPGTEKPAKGIPAGDAAGTGEGQAVEYGKQTAEEAGDAATRGAKQPVKEKKRGVMDSIEEGAMEGVKKLFKW